MRVCDCVCVCVCVFVVCVCVCVTGLPPLYASSTVPDADEDRL